MKTILQVCLLFVAVSVFGAAPIVRNDFTTNKVPGSKLVSTNAVQSTDTIPVTTDGGSNTFKASAAAVVAGGAANGISAPTVNTGSILISNSMQNLQAFRAKLAYNDAGNYTNVSILWIGDSWGTQANITDPLTRYLWMRFGYGGMGWFCAAITNQATPLGFVLTNIGTWYDEVDQKGTNGLSLASSFTIDTNTPASKVWTFYDSDIWLHYKGTNGGGTFRYRINTGTWTNVDTSLTTGLQIIPIPQSIHSLKTLTVEAVTPGTGGIHIYGALTRDYVNGSRYGVVLNNASYAGTRAEHWEAAQAGDWEKAVTNAAPDLCVIMLGVNDNINNKVPSDYENSMSNIVVRVRNVMPLCSFVLFSPGDIATNGTYGTAAYTLACRDLANRLGITHLNGNLVLGPWAYGNSVGEYKDVNHPAPAGGVMLARYFIDQLGLGDSLLRYDRTSIGGSGEGVPLIISSSKTAQPGNQRGTNALEMQMYRASSSHIASGISSTIGGGSDNTASGSYSTVPGGSANTASGDYSFAAGNATVASESQSFATGINTAAVMWGERAHSSGIFAAQGDAQNSVFVERVTTTSNTPAELRLNGSSKHLVMPANTTWIIRAQVVARSTDAGTGDEESAGYEITAVMERDNTAAATRVNAQTVTTLFEDDAAWNVAITADTSLGGPIITVTGNNETLVRWVATIWVTQVGG